MRIIHHGVIHAAAGVAKPDFQYNRCSAAPATAGHVKRDLHMIFWRDSLAVAGKAEQSLLLARRWATLPTAIHVMWDL